jgi:hypothetical protein
VVPTSDDTVLTSEDTFRAMKDEFSVDQDATLKTKLCIISKEEAIQIPQNIILITTSQIFS